MTKDKEKDLKVGIIGTGGIANGKHAPRYKALDGVSLLAACDIEEEKAEEFARKYDIPHVFTDYEEMLEMEELDAVSVCTWNRAHSGPTIAALEAGKHVHCEKPLAHNAKDARKMVQADKNSEAILQIGLQLHFQAGNRALKRLAEEGFFGDIYYGRAMAMRRRGMPGRSFIEEDKAGGGCLIDIGVHILDCLLWVLGYPKPVEAFGAIDAKFGNKPDLFNPGWGDVDPDKFSVEDFGMGTIKFENGLRITLETSWASHVKDSGKTFFIGDEAGATIDPTEIFTDDGERLLSYPPAKTELEESGFPGQFEAFKKAILEGDPSPVPAEDVLITSEIFDAIYQSAEEGGSVKIEI